MWSVMSCFSDSVFVERRPSSGSKASQHGPGSLGCWLSSDAPLRYRRIMPRTGLIDSIRSSSRTLARPLFIERRSSTSPLASPNLDHDVSGPRDTRIPGGHAFRRRSIELENRQSSSDTASITAASSTHPNDRH